MTPHAALNRQIELYRTMTGEHDLRSRWTSTNLPATWHVTVFDANSPDAGEVERQLRRRIELGRRME